MAISRIKTWTTEVLTSSDLNTEFNNILNNGTDVAFPLTKAVSGGGFSVTNWGSTTFASGKTLTMTAGSQYWSKGADIASASTVTLGVDGNFFHITGTATITGFVAAQAGHFFMLAFDGALTLTYNATSLILPTTANIVTAVGDTAIFIAETTANMRCLSYNRADGTAVSTGVGVTTGLLQALAQGFPAMI